MPAESREIPPVRLGDIAPASQRDPVKPGTSFADPVVSEPCAGPKPYNPSGLTYRLWDVGLLLAMGAAAFVLGCQELFDGDVWWHLRTGQWIWQNGRIPTQDLFTFTSAGRPWIDLHWLFQVVLALAYAAGGVRGMITLAAAAGASTVLVGLTARDRRSPSWVVAACWLPALLAMSARLVPRPEVLSFLAMAIYLSILLRCDDHPALAWLLPAVQLFWVNAHALFVLGPIILFAYLLGQWLDALLHGNSRGPLSPRWHGRRWWAHLGGSAAAVGLACLANPYGLHGAIFPFQLYPKITQWGGSYKTLIIEFVNLREYIQRQGLPALGSLYTRLTCFLLLALPLSFIIPCAWRAADRDAPMPFRSAAWRWAFGAAASLILTFALGLPGHKDPRGILPMGRFAPLGLAALGIAGAASLVRFSRLAALAAAIGGLAEAAWAGWLWTHLVGPEQGVTNWLGGTAARAAAWSVVVLAGAAAP